jgi:hypothetical protein
VSVPAVDELHVGVVVVPAVEELHVGIATVTAIDELHVAAVDELHGVLRLSRLLRNSMRVWQMSRNSRKKGLL